MDCRGFVSSIGAGRDKRPSTEGYSKYDTQKRKIKRKKEKQVATAYRRGLRRADTKGKTNRKQPSPTMSHVIAHDMFVSRMRAWYEPITRPYYIAFIQLHWYLKDTQNARDRNLWPWPCVRGMPGPVLGQKTHPAIMIVPPIGVMGPSHLNLLRSDIIKR